MFEVVEGPAHDAGKGGAHHGARAGHLAHPRGPEVDIVRAGVELAVGLQQGLERLHLHRAAEPHPHCLVPHDAVRLLERCRSVEAAPLPPPASISEG